MRSPPRWRGNRMARAGRWSAVALTLATCLPGAGRAADDAFPGLRVLPTAPAPPTDGRLSVTYFGVSTLLLDDGETQLLLDGFLTRPGREELLLKLIEPKPTIVDAILRRAGADRIAAVLTAHAHYDHVLDAGYIAKSRGAKLVGSPSVAFVGAGAGVPAGDMWTPAHRDTFTCGRFNVTVRHAPHARGNLVPGDIESMLEPPKRARAYRASDSYSYVIEHRGRRILVQPSANLPDAPEANPQADIVFLSVGMLGWRSRGFVGRYWGANVHPRRTRYVVPIHWDDPSRLLWANPLTGGDARLEPSPRPIERVDAALARLREVDVRGILRDLPVAEQVALDLPAPTAAAGPSPARGCVRPAPRPPRRP